MAGDEWRMTSTTKTMQIDQIQHTGDTQIRVQLDYLAVEDYARAMQEGSIFPPIDVFFDGSVYWLGDGFHRIESATRLDLDTIEAKIHQGGRREAILFAIDKNQRYGVRLTTRDKQRIVKLFLNDEVWVELSDREIARRCGVSHQTVVNYRDSICQFLTDRESKPRKATRNGKTYTMDTENIGKPTLVEPEPPQETLFEDASAPETVEVEEVITPAISSNGLSIHYSSETPEHYTPKHILSMVSEVMNGIDLDPCSNSKDDPNVPAGEHYTLEDDGLSQTWNGSVFLNPPYGREIGGWIDKLRQEFENGHVTEAIALVPARVDTSWWNKLTSTENAYPLVCFIKGRLTFIGNDDPAPFPSAVVYLGDNRIEFYFVFSAIGCIWSTWNDEIAGITDYGSA